MTDNLVMNLDEGLPAALDDTNAVQGKQAVCRVCYHGGNVDSGPLVSPCACKGSIGLTHERCLQRWLRERDSDRCNVCLHRYAVRRDRAPLYGFFLDRNNRSDVLRMILDVVSGSGDVMMLVFSWSYANGFLGWSDWIIYLLVLGALLFQTVFWFVVEVVRVRTWFESVRKWRKKMASMELVVNGGDGGAPNDPQDGLPVAEEGKASASNFNTAMKNSQFQLKTRPDRESPSSGTGRSKGEDGASPAKRSVSADTMRKRPDSNRDNTPLDNTL